MAAAEATAARRERQTGARRPCRRAGGWAPPGGRRRPPRVTRGGGRSESRWLTPGTAAGVPPGRDATTRRRRQRPTVSGGVHDAQDASARPARRVPPVGPAQRRGGRRLGGGGPHRRRGASATAFQWLPLPSWTGRRAALPRKAAHTNRRNNRVLECTVSSFSLQSGRKHSFASTVLYLRGWVRRLQTMPPRDSRGKK